MINNIYKDLTILSVSYKSDHILEKFLTQFNSKFKIILVENSSNIYLKEKLLKKFKNLDVILSGKNIGFGGAFNLGVKKVKTKYILHVNPDAKIDLNNIIKLYVFLKKNSQVGIVAPQEILLNNKFINKNNSLKDVNSYNQVNHVRGFVMMLNFNNCKNTKFFDENFFLYMEEIDFCIRLRKLGKKIFVLNYAVAKHLGGQSHNPTYNFEMELQRNWHYMWSLFYFNKKHYGILFAIKKTLKKLITSFFKTIFYFIFRNHNKYFIYKSRLIGLSYAYFNKKSNYRIS